jgi:hypothetical protein
LKGDYLGDLNNTEEDFIGVIKFIAELALKVETLFPENQVLIHEQDSSGQSQYSKDQVGCVIANGFFWLIPEQDFSLDMPSLINFYSWHWVDSDIYIEKLKFYYHYFKVLMTEGEEGNH